MLRTMPFLRSFVVAMRACQPSYVGDGVARTPGTSAGVYRQVSAAPQSPGRGARPSLAQVSSHTMRTVTAVRLVARADRQRLQRRAVERPRSAATCPVGEGRA